MLGCKKKKLRQIRVAAVFAIPWAGCGEVRVRLRNCRRPTWLRPCLLFRKRLHAPFKRDSSPPPLKIAHALAQYPPTTTSDTVVAQNSVEVFSPWLAIRKAATFYQQRQTPEFSVCRELSGCLGTTEMLFVDKNSPAIETIGCLKSVNSAAPSVDLKKNESRNYSCVVGETARHDHMPAPL